MVIRRRLRMHGAVLLPAAELGAAVRVGSPRSLLLLR